jgi:hypothetical protein
MKSLIEDYSGRVLPKNIKRSVKKLCGIPTPAFFVRSSSNGKNVVRIVWIAKRYPTEEAALERCKALLEKYPPLTEPRKRGRHYPDWCITPEQRDHYLKTWKPPELKIKLPRGIIHKVFRNHPSMGPREGFEARLMVNGIMRCNTFTAQKYGSLKKAFQEALKALKSYQADNITEKVWNGGRIAVNPISVPREMRCPGLTISSSSATLTVRRSWGSRKKMSNIELHYHYSVEGHAGFDNFHEALEKARKGSEVLFSLDRSGLDRAKELFSKSEQRRKKTLNTSNALRTFSALEDATVSFEDLAGMNHYYASKRA